MELRRRRVRRETGGEIGRACVARAGWALLIAALVVSAPSPVAAQDTWSSPAPGIYYLFRTTSQPMRIHVLIVDLCAPGMSMRATGPSEGGSGITTSQFASLVGAQAAVNASFSGGGAPYAPYGLSIGNGEPWPGTSDSTDNSGFIAFGADRVQLQSPSDNIGDPLPWMTESVGTGEQILLDGAVPTWFWSTVCVDDARHQGQFGADDGQIDGIVAGEVKQAVDVLGADGNVLHGRLSSRPGVTRGHVNCVHQGRLGRLPGQRVLASAAADDQYLHCLLPLLIRKRGFYEKRWPAAGGGAKALRSGLARGRLDRRTIGAATIPCLGADNWIQRWSIRPRLLLSMNRTMWTTASAVSSVFRRSTASACFRPDL